MKIAILGGGPGGLYAGILLKKQQPEHEIDVYERNAPDATFGWGVVFSDRTLDSLREADQPTQQAIADSFAHWDAIDVYHRGETIRSYGHAFAGISRKVLLNILQRRCAELGVTLHFHAEFTGPEAFLDRDLVIASDGVNSTVRRAYADAFKPSLLTRPSKYVWLGTTLRPDAFTYIVQETAHGSFLGQMYPYSDEMSTMVIECHQDTWRRAGLE